VGSLAVGCCRFGADDANEGSQSAKIGLVHVKELYELH
jgi:hypothetical protein